MRTALLFIVFAAIGIGTVLAAPARGPGEPITVGNEVRVHDTFASGSAGITLEDHDAAVRWEVVTGAWVARDRAALLEQAGAGPSIAVADASTRDATASVTLSGDPVGSGLVFRFCDRRNYWSLTAVSGRKWVVEQVVAGETRRVAAFEAFAVGPLRPSVADDVDGTHFSVDRSAAYSRAKTLPGETPEGCDRAGLVTDREPSVGVTFQNFVIAS